MKKIVFILLLLSMVSVLAFGAAAPGPSAVSIVKDPWIDVRAFGAKGDGTTDDTTAIQNAINAANTGTVKRVYFPAPISYYKITSELTLYGGIEYFGDGINSQVRQATSDTNVLAATNQDDFSVHDLYLYGPGDTGAGTNGNGIFLVNCDRVKIYNNKFENIGLCGVNLKNSDYNTIQNNFITNSGKDSVNASGIYVGLSSSYNLIKGNIITNDKHGILVQTVGVGENASYNILIGNIIKTCDRYGIVLYNTGFNSNMYGNRIIGNNIRDISDALAENFGAGIYCTGVKYTSIADNYIENTNQGTVNDTLAPGGIGVISFFHGTIIGNTIVNAQFHGITIRGGTGGAIGLHITVSNNTISDSIKYGIEVQNQNDITLVGNTVYGGSTHGIRVIGSDHTNLVIVDNICTDVNNVGIIIDGYNHVRIANNVVSDSVVTTGISLTNSDYVTILNNICNNNNTRGIDISTGNTYTTVHKNTCVGNATGISVTSATTIVDFKDNIVTGNSTNWNNGPFTTLATGAATPSVKGGRYFLTAGTTTITDFDDGYTGQIIHILAVTSITIDDDPNIFLNGSANFPMTDTDILTLICKADGLWYEISRSDSGA